MAKRPLREASESITSQIPDGPLGIVGKGNVLGGLRYFQVSTINGILPLDGIRVGFQVESHSVDRSGDGEVHEYVIHAASKNVVRFLADYKSAPSNVNFFTREKKSVEIEKIKERRWMTTWRARVEIEQDSLKKKLRDDTEEETSTL